MKNHDILFRSLFLVLMGGIVVLMGYLLIPDPILTKESANQLKLDIKAYTEANSQKEKLEVFYDVCQIIIDVDSDTLTDKQNELVDYYAKELFEYHRNELLPKTDSIIQEYKDEIDQNKNR